MTIHHRLLPAPTVQRPAPLLSLAASAAAAGARIAQWLAVAADYWAAAATYERLSGLSDAELNRRGLSRATLAWDISQACDRANR